LRCGRPDDRNKPAIRDLSLSSKFGYIPDRPRRNPNPTILRNPVTRNENPQQLKAKNEEYGLKPHCSPRLYGKSAGAEKISGALNQLSQNYERLMKAHPLLTPLFFGV